MKVYILIFVLFSYLSCRNETVDSNPKIEVENKKEFEISEDKYYSKICEIPLPEGFERMAVDSQSFGFYLRNLKLKEDKTVYLFNGDKKYNQSAQFAVVDIDVGTKDLQQCADAVMRLRAEYLFLQKKYKSIHFNFLSDGKPRYYTDYAGNDRTYGKFRKYMDYIFSYANTKSLKNEMQNISISEMQIGDVLIQIGNPYGHAVIVVDMAENKTTGEKIFMIAQSYMPAQNIHVLKNYNDKSISPWYLISSDENIYTPEWTFTINDLHRFKE